MNEDELEDYKRTVALAESIDDDEGARRMLEYLTDPGLPNEQRAEATIKLGPGLQMCAERLGWDDPMLYFSKEIFEEIDETFRKLYRDASTPKLVRRRILEAGVRFPQDWHDDAVRAAFEADDQDWQKTALFCMQYLPGFDEEILEVLDRDEPSEDLLGEAVRAAGSQNVSGAVQTVRELATGSNQYDKWIQKTAIHALTGFDDPRCEQTLEELSIVVDQEIADLALEALQEWRMWHDMPDDLPDSLDLDDL